MPKKNRYEAVALSYFLFFVSLGSFVPFVSLYLGNAGWSGTAVGIYFAIGPLTTFLTQPLWGLIGDSWGNLPWLFTLLLLASGFGVAIFAALPPTPIFYLQALLFGFFQGPLLPMLDSMTIRILGPHKNEWGAVRLWGSVGFAVITSVMGKLFGVNRLLPFFGYGLGTLLTSFAILSLRSFQVTKPEQTPDRQRFQFKGIGAVLSREFVAFLAAMFILQLAQNLPATFLSLVMTDRGASGLIVGLTWSIAALVEIPILLGASRLLLRHPPERLLVWAALFNACRLFVFALSYHPLLMLVTHALDGLAYAIILVALVLIVDRLIPRALHATGFTLHTAFTVTLPRLLGGLWGGQIYDKWGGTALYLVSSACTLLGVLAFLLGQRLQRKRSSPNLEGM